MIFFSSYLLPFSSLFFVPYFKAAFGEPCDAVMGFADVTYQFQSPNYPQTLGNNSYMCTLKIHHTPTLEEAIAAALGKSHSDICGGDSSTETGDGSNNGDGGDGSDEDDSNGNGSHGGGNLGPICQVRS